MYTWSRKEPLFRKKYRENAKALTRCERFIIPIDQEKKFRRMLEHRELLKSYDSVTIEAVLLFFERAGLEDPFRCLMFAHRAGISLSNFAAKRRGRAG